jgi:hypothetical protein
MRQRLVRSSLASWVFAIAACGHLRRAFDESMFFEDEIEDAAEHFPLKNLQTFFIHSPDEEAQQCFGIRMEVVGGIADRGWNGSNDVRSARSRK